MNLTFVALNYAPSVGGAQTLVRELAEGLVGRGHRVQVLTTDSLGTPGSADHRRISPKDEVVRGVTVRRFGTRGPLGTVLNAVRWVRSRTHLVTNGRVLSGAIPPILSGPWSVPFARAVRRAHATDDVVVGCSAPFLTLVAVPFLRGRGRAADICMPLLHLQAGAPHPWVVRALRRADGTTATTSHELARQAELGISPSAIALLPPGVDPEQFPDRTAAEARAELGLPERLTVGYVGRLARYKGIDTLFDASRCLWDRRPELTVLVAGSPSGWVDFDTVAAGVAAVGGDRLVVRTAFTDAEKALLFSACDVVVFPSREESFGIVTVEAWASRRPVVAADIDAVRSLIRDGIDGDLVPVDDDRALADAVEALLADPARRAAYGHAGRHRVEAELSWSRIIDQWEDFLQVATARRDRRADSTGVR